MRLSSKKLLVAALSAGTLLGSATGAVAGDWYSGGSSGSYDRGGDFRAVSYINRDTGAPTQNDDVNLNSSCSNPDQYDMQAFSPVGTATKNVHNDACFLDSNNNKVGKNIGASFQSSGTGFISACPDPDRVVTNGVVVSNGPATSKLQDLNGDGRNDSCFQSSYQETGKAGDFEYHARLNNTGMTGSQDVKWGKDSDGDGRIDDRNDDSVKVDWSADGKTGSSYRW